MNASAQRRESGRERELTGLTDRLLVDTLALEARLARLTLELDDLEFDFLFADQSYLQGGNGSFESSNGGVLAENMECFS